MKKNAFTLIELSIVLVIIGLLIGGSFKILKVMRERAQISRAQDDVQVAKEAVIGYVQTTHQLPSNTVFDSSLSPEKNNQHPLLYIFGIDSGSNSNNICSYTQTDLKVVTAEGNEIPDIAFVVASEAANHNMQTGLTDNGDGTYSVKTYNYATKVDDNTSPVNIVENYDDIVDWVTLSQLQEKAKCSDNPLRIVNTSLPNTDTENSTDYNAKIVVDGNYSEATVDCTFTDNNNFSYNSNDFTITNAGTTTGGTTTTVTCTLSADGKTVTKKFTIDVSQSTTNSTGGGGPFGGGGRGRP